MSLSALRPALSRGRRITAAVALGLALGVGGAAAVGSPAAAAPGDHAWCDDYKFSMARNSEGKCVELIQVYLYQYGFGSYLNGHGGIDGDFGAATDRAVRAFQNKYKSRTGPADGEVGPKTWATFGYLA
ncbi:peptidoglycan-binding domain-containing protein [Cryptosporangium aurantiacum]|uniref:Putative peptidoglycan binding domain-containing protein n=1 Tax=Cryptosporangium aurantiacum TaxID=134849 RepID=A0A1M7TXX7_9ACTN|nr:peptidoglycan-binding domain-containing protein [Cryptosporangium aurantiacum]SHN75537.1 Putative peptidoglycan binding domain-containing protein [Cryptosporangium aurantiacum]